MSMYTIQIEACPRSISEVHGAMFMQLWDTICVQYLYVMICFSKTFEDHLAQSVPETL